MDATGTTNYQWDARGRLTKAVLPNGQSVDYSFDALGRRASRSYQGNTTSFLYDGSDVVADNGYSRDTCKNRTQDQRGNSGSISDKG